MILHLADKNFPVQDSPIVQILQGSFIGRELSGVQSILQDL